MEDKNRNTPSSEKVDAQVVSWGTALLTLTVLSVSVYFFILSLQASGPAAVNFVSRVLFLSSIVSLVVSLVLQFVKRQELGLKITFFTLFAIGLMAVTLFQGRVMTASISILLVSLGTIRWLVPKEQRRAYVLMAVLGSALMWGIEWLDPTWRIELATPHIGPIAGLVFGLLLGILEFYQARNAINQSLRLKSIVWMGGIIIILSATLATYSILTLRQAAIDSAQAGALAIADSQARQIRADAEIPLDTARALAEALTAIKDPQSNLEISREQVNALLRQVLAENPSYLGTYTLWEPNAFDGQDSQFRNQPAHDETGRFIPYWIRSDDGTISVIALEQYETPGIGDWYVLPRQNKREMTFAPLIYPINGVDTVMASFVVPVTYSGTFYGIVGIDAPIAFVQDIVNNVNLYNGKADALLMTSSGTLIGVRNRPELANKPATQILPDFAEYQSRIEAGEAFAVLSSDGNFLRVFAPVDLGQTGQHWAFSLIIPFSEITAPATAASVRQVMINGALILAAFALLWFLTGQFVSPIRELTATANAISQGNLDATAHIQSQDETGILAAAFNSMTSRLKETLDALENRVAERTRNLELASEVGRSVSQVRELDVMLREAVEIIRSRFDLYYAQVYLINSARDTLQLRAGTGSVGSELIGRGHQLPVNTGSINGRAVVEKRPVIIENTAASATFRPNPLLPETRSEMSIPLMVGETVVGALDLQSRAAGSLNRDMLTAFEALAGQLAIAIQNARLLEESKQARAEVEAQASRLARTNWKDYLDAIHKAERVGYVYENNEILPLVEEEMHLPADAKTVSAPIAVSGEKLGSLVVELTAEGQTPRNTELVNIVASQVAQQIESLRLLESAERYRIEAEETTRRATAEGWREYIETRGDASLRYLYDRNEVTPAASAEVNASEKSITLPLKAREETIGKLAILDVDENDGDAAELASAIAERLGAHLENLRLFEETKRGQIELDKRARELESVAEISSVSARELDIQKMLETVVFLTQRRFGLYHAHVFTYDEHAKHLKIVACGWKEGDAHEGNHGTTVIALEQEQSLVARAAREKRAVVVNDVQGDPGWLPNPALPDTRSEMAVPLLVGDQLLGVLDVQKDFINGFNDEDIAVKSTLATQVATALQNARSFEQAQKQAERESALNVISQKIQSATTVEAVLQIAARELGHALGAPLTIAQLGVKNGDN